MTTTPTCVPAEGAEDGSLHWVEHDAWGHRLWVWQGKEWNDREFNFMTNETGGWRYIGPASPADASDLAAARAELKEYQLATRQALDAYEIAYNHTVALRAELAAACKERDSLRLNIKGAFVEGIAIARADIEETFGHSMTTPNSIEILWSRSYCARRAADGDGHE